MSLYVTKKNFPYRFYAIIYISYIKLNHFSYTTELPTLLVNMFIKISHNKFYLVSNKHPWISRYTFLDTAKCRSLYFSKVINSFTLVFIILLLLLSQIVL